jgi:HEAT repeat protein
MTIGKTNSIRLLRRVSRTFMLTVAMVAASFAASAIIEGKSRVNQAPNSLTPLQLEIEKQKQRLASTEVEERRDALMRLGALRRAEASRVAAPALADPIPIVRATATHALLSLPAEEGAAALIPLLQDKDEFVRQQAAYALGGTRNRTATSPLVERLRMDKKDSVRAAATVALGQIRDESAVLALAEVLSTTTPSGKKGKTKKNEFILRAAAHSLGEIGSRAGVPVLIEALANDYLAGDVRREAARSLGVIGDPAAIPVLRSASIEADAHLSQIASEALRRIAANSMKRS